MRGCGASPLIARIPQLRLGLGACLTFWRSVGPCKCEGLEGPHANRCGERLASGVSRRARRLFGQFSLRAAVFAHPTDAAGTMVGFEGEITSIEASFDFHPLKIRDSELQNNNYIYSSLFILLIS